jgi:hypothetical protein
MFVKVTLSALALAVSIPALASAGQVSDFSAGHVQIAKQAGVEPGRLSTGDLNRLIIAQRNGDVVLVKFLLDS